MSLHLVDFTVDYNPGYDMGECTGKVGVSLFILSKILNLFSPNSFDPAIAQIACHYFLVILSFSIDLD